MPATASVNLADFPMKFVQVTRNPDGIGHKQFVFSLPNSVRLLYAEDPVKCEDWKKLILDFDSKFLNQIISSLIAFFLLSVTQENQSI